MTDTVTAHHDYEAQQDDELSFQAGDLITVTDHSNADWWMGTKQKDGTSGFFPSNFVEAVQEKDAQQSKEKPSQTTTTVSNEETSSEEAPTQEPEEKQPPQSIGMARVMEDYAMQSEDELTLHKGGIVILYEKQEDDWLVGEINGKQGRFPAKYVEEIDMPGGRPDLGKEAPSHDGVPGGFKLAAFGVKQGGIGSLLAGGIPTLKKTVKSPSKEDGPVSPAATATAPPPAVASPTTPPVAASPSTPVNVTKPIEQADSSINKPLAKAIVLHPYNAENDDELNLIRGEYIDILDRQADVGWWQGRNEKNQLGVFPSNFVKEVDEAHQAPPPPIRSRQSVAATGSSPIVPSESRPFSTPAPSLASHTRAPASIQRLPPLPDAVETTKTDDDKQKEDLDTLEFEGTPVGDLAPNEINTPPEQASPTKEVQSSAKEVESSAKEVELPAKEVQSSAKEVESSAKEVESPAKEVQSPAKEVQSPTKEVQSPTKEEQSPVKEEESPIVPVPDVALLDQQEPVTKDEQPEHQHSATATEPKKEDITFTEVKKEEEKEDATLAATQEEKEHDALKETHVEESVAPMEESPVEESPVEEVSKSAEVLTPAEEVSTPVNESPVDEATESTDKKTMGLPLPTAGPRLVSPNRTGRPSNRAGTRRPPTAHKDDAPSQTELLQQELEKTPEEPATTSEPPSSPPPKPIKPIFAKFPTPFAMGGEGVPTKNLKPVQRRMFEPAPAHEPTSPPTDDTNDRPATGGVRGLASRFAGLPGTGGGNEVMETKLKNFTKNEVEKVRKELAEERARVDSLEALVKTLHALVAQLQQQAS